MRTSSISATAAAADLLRTVAAAHRYTGVDLSTVQIERARRRIPAGRFIVADATQLELSPESFDAMMSLFVLGHSMWLLARKP